MLVDLEVLFDVQMRAELEAARPQRKSFMNFEDALVDRGVCAQGLHFFSSAQDVELRERRAQAAPGVKIATVLRFGQNKR